MITYSDFEKYATGKVADYAPFINHCEVYKVKINGIDIPVYECNISKFPFNKIYRGFQRAESQTEKAYYINLFSDEPLDIEVTLSGVKAGAKTAKLKPYAFGVTPKLNGDKVTFLVKRHGFFALHINDHHNPLYIFNSEIITPPEKSEVTLFVGAGVIRKDFRLKSGETLYIDKDAYVYGNILIENAENVKIFGGGVLDDSYEERGLGSCYRLTEDTPIGVGNVKIINSKNIEISGVSFVNSACFSIASESSEDIKIDGVKVFGHWRYNTDGIDFMNCRNVTVKNSFVSVFDDCVCVKGIAYRSRDIYNFLFEDLVLSNDWGRACEIGLETFADNISNVTFNRVHVIKCDDVAFDVQNGDFAHVKNVKFLNSTLECESYYTPHELQKSINAVYTRGGEANVTQLLNVVNFRMLGSINSKVIFGWNYDLADKGENSTVNEDITLENVSVYYDEKLGKADGKYRLPIVVESVIDGKKHKNVTVKNVTVNGEKLTDKNADITLKGVENFVIE